MQYQWRLEGVDALRTQMQRLPPIAINRIVKPAFVAGGAFIKRAIKAAAPRGRTGNLKRGVAVEVARFFNPLMPLVEIGWKRGKRGASHAHLVEKGTAERRTRKGASRGAARATPFFERAVALSHAAAANVIQMAWATKLAIEARRYATGGLDATGRILR